MKSNFTEILRDCGRFIVNNADDILKCTDRITDITVMITISGDGEPGVSVDVSYKPEPSCGDYNIWYDMNHLRRT